MPAWEQEWQYGTVWYIGSLRYSSIFAKKYSTLVCYTFFVLVRVRYVGALFELKIPDFYFFDCAEFLYAEAKDRRLMCELWIKIADL